MTFSIGSPYLNKHGEAAGGLIGSGDSGTLNPGRYDHLNKAWLSQNIISSIYKRLVSHFSRLSVRGMAEPLQNLMTQLTNNMANINDDESMVNPLNAAGELNPAFFMNQENNGLGGDLDDEDDDDYDDDNDDQDDDDPRDRVTLIPAGLEAENARFILNALLNNNFMANTEPPEALDDDSE
ncbi:unnamed protein product [Ambrosiozyma monospora]|uniref:Unnamed protein product n=1 Tax=Ambrosiozyma monospora TaxID=43982 RepID=A0A9W6WBJ6_AMBMO|nr:unnamed protein product [Ambrosiozyma monospora]